MTDYHNAMAVGRNIEVSNKQAREVLGFIKGMKVDTAIKRLERVLIHDEAVPFKRFNSKVAHKKGIGPGRYPEKACDAIIDILKSAKNNALNKGLQEEKLIISEGVVGMALSKRKRIRQRKASYTGSMRLSNILIKLSEKEEDKKDD
ncbi:MAG: 50S ribosomal protein L22 [Candidatus Nanoarchaeia archaeon]|jgi:ribosomal protein uL22